MNDSIKRCNKIDLVGVVVVSVFIFGVLAYFMISGANRASRWPMAMIALELAMFYILKNFVGYEVVEVVRCKYCGKKDRTASSNMQATQ